MEDVRRVDEHRLERVGSEGRVVLENLVLSPTRGEQPENEVDRQPRSANYRLAGKNLRIGRDVLGPVRFHARPRAQLGPAPADTPTDDREEFRQSRGCTELPLQFVWIRVVAQPIAELVVTRDNGQHQAGLVLLRYRVLYVARFAEAIYVLHAFAKKTQQTRQADLEIARRNLADVLGHRRKG